VSNLGKKIRGGWAGSLLREVRHPSQLKIGGRLTLSFVVIVLLMVAADAVALWQFELVRGQAQRIYDVDQRSMAVLRVQSNLWMFRDKLEDLVTAQDAPRFRAETASLRRVLLLELELAMQALSVSPSGVERDPVLLSTIETIQSGLPAQIDALNDLAATGDWPAVHLRLINQTRTLSSLTSSLVEKVDFEVARERAQALENIQRGQRRVILMLPITAFLTLLTAGMLGLLVTRSITRPLAQLDAGAQALARGEFLHQVLVTGQDELATLGQAFNYAARRLRDLYEALTSSEERFRTMVQTAQVGIAILDSNGAVRMCNPRFLDIVGLTEEQALGKRLEDPNLNAFREDGATCPLEERPSVKAAASQKAVLNIVLRHTHPLFPEGKWLLTSAWPLLRPNGSVDQVITTLTDITEQKKVEEELRSGRELLAQAQKAAKLGCFDYDIKKDVIVWSTEMAEIYGTTLEAFGGRRENWESMVLPDDLAPTKATLGAGVKTGEALAEYRIRRQNDGEIRWLESRGRVLLDDAQEPIRLIGVSMDITDRKQAEESLLRSEAEFRIIFENAAIGMVLLDPSGRPLRGNRALQSMLGYTDEELTSFPFVDVTHPDDVALDRSLYREVVEGKRDRYQIKKRCIHKDGTLRWARLTVSAFRNESAQFQYSVAMIEDITQQEHAERSLRQLSSRMMRIQEEEQRRVAREVHDSTSQEMTALTLNLGALRLTEEALSPKTRKRITECLVLAKRVAREIRTFSYLLHPPMLNELGLWSALTLFIQEFKDRSGLRVNLWIASELEGSQLDPSQEMALFRFVQEAMANVHRHSGSKTVAVEIHLQGDMIRASVTDTGRGIPAKLLRELQASDGHVGGVGVRGMKERIGHLGGHLEIQSDSGGASVAAVVPRFYLQGSMNETSEQAAAVSPPFSPRKVG
jgi:two-component system, NarL family, sensor kinase